MSGDLGNHKEVKPTDLGEHKEAKPTPGAARKEFYRFRGGDPSADKIQTEAESSRPRGPDEQTQAGIFDEIMQHVEKIRIDNEGIESYNAHFIDSVKDFIREKIKDERSKIYDTKKGERQEDNEVEELFAQMKDEHTIKEQIYVAHDGITRWCLDMRRRVHSAEYEGKAADRAEQEGKAPDRAEQEGKAPDGRNKDKFAFAAIWTFISELRDAAEYESKWQALKPHTDIAQRTTSHETLKRYYRMADEAERYLTREISGKPYSSLENLRKHYTDALQNERGLSKWEKWRRRRHAENPKRELDYLGALGEKKLDLHLGKQRKLWIQQRGYRYTPEKQLVNVWEILKKG